MFTLMLPRSGDVLSRWLFARLKTSTLGGSDILFIVSGIAFLMAGDIQSVGGHVTVDIL